MPSIAGPAVGRTDLGLESPSYINTAIRGTTNTTPFVAIRVHSWFKTPRSHPAIHR
jgi:hypothetical protein